MTAPRLDVLILSLLALSNHAAAEKKGLQKLLPTFLRRSKVATYTPLLFFTLPPGINPVCDTTDRVVRQVERELQVHVERLDILRQPENEGVLLAVAQSLSPPPGSPQPPFLYHRESRQIYQVAVPNANKKTASSTANNIPYIDKERIRAWAKGRYLSPSIGGGHRVAPAAAPDAPVVDDATSGAMDQAELMEEMSLTPEQLKGKRLMQERTKARESAK
jgi:hypothetical protein